jgi:hypothetical protein
MPSRSAIQRTSDALAVDVQVVHDQMPSFGFRGAGDQPLEMSDAIVLASRWTPGWFDHLTGGHIEIDEPGKGSMPDIFKLTAQHVAWLHGQIGMLALQGLHSCQFIHADRAFSLFRSLGCLSVELTALHDLLFSLRVFLLVQPIPETVRLEAPFLSSRAACRGEIWLTIPRFFNSSAISLPVHWLMGRPVFAGASQARAAI